MKIKAPQSTNIKNFYNDENNILCVKPLENFLGKCNVINKLVKSGNLNKSLYSGNTILLKISEENKKKTDLYMSVQI